MNADGAYHPDEVVRGAQEDPVRGLGRVLGGTYHLDWTIQGAQADPVRGREVNSYGLLSTTDGMGHQLAVIVDRVF